MCPTVNGHKKGLRGTEGLCIHDGGDEGDRTPDLLTASQALSQLSYAPVTTRYYRGRSSGMQGEILDRFSALRDFLGRDKTLMQQIRYCDTHMDGYFGG